MFKEINQEPVYERTVDVLVLGAGLAGLVTAIFLNKRGRHVAIIASGAGFVVASTGFVDVIERTPSGETIEDLQEILSAFKSRWPDHPYAKADWETLFGAEQDLLEILNYTGLEYIIPYQTANVQVVTALGTLKRTHLLPKSAAIANILNKKSIIVLSFRGLANFNPCLVHSNLAGLFPGAKIKWAIVDLPLNKATNIQSITIAKWFDNDEHQEEIFKRIIAAIPQREKPDIILLPAVLGLRKHYTIWNKLRDTLGVEVLEVPTLPPSVPGIRLFNALRFFLETRKVYLNLNCQAIRAGIAGGEVKYVDAFSEGKIVRYRSRYYILATGGIAGGGLIEKNGQIHDPIFGSPITGASRLDYKTFPVNVGVAVDDTMRVRRFSNLWACGRILGGYNPYFERCGNGIALATARKISKTLGREGGDESTC